MSARGRRHLATSPFRPAPEMAVECYALDDRVSHDVHGLGRVVGVEANAVTVDFGTGTGSVRIVSPFARMEHL